MAGSPDNSVTLRIIRGTKPAVTTTIHDVLDAIRQQPLSNHERGERFERLMVRYLSLDPLYAEKYSEVWTWPEWPGNRGRGDTGIDLVAQERATGQYCAIQCKFYEPQHHLAKSDIDSFFTASGKSPFTSRIIISTTDRWGRNAEEALEHQTIPVSRIGLANIAESKVEWELIQPGVYAPRLAPKKKLRDHQRQAVDAVLTGFATHHRGKLIMACGTGKTFTSLKIAEHVAVAKAKTGGGATVLFLVPSISLLSQTLREWTSECETPFRAFAVCSDSKVAKRADTEDIRAHDLAFPATTDTARLVQQMAATDGAAQLTVIFSTYQSIGTISAAQQRHGIPEFDLVICDEAHRTTGVTLAGQDESNFVKVHDNGYIKAIRRLYMTATPRLFNDATQTAARQHEAVLCSMDDEALYGPEFHRLGFGKAVAQGLLTDYKVLILTVDEKHVATSLQRQFADEDNELSQLDDAVKIVGCWNGLAKRPGGFADGTGFQPGEAPMRRAVAFAKNIADSQKITKLFGKVISDYDSADEDILHCEVRHVDGTFNSLRRNELLDWLKQDPGEHHARILSNARCLSEGVDVPDLDAVLFLHPRNSVVDVVQSVGRVMRKAEGKQYGYIILPVGIPADMAPEKALADNRRFKTVWQVLQALRAHDDRFNATVNQLDLNSKRPNNIMVGHAGPEEDSLGGDGSTDPSKTTTRIAQQLTFDVEDWRDAIYAKIVTKVGERHYWEDWAKDIAQIAERHVARIETALELPEKRAAFGKFVDELRAGINPGVTTADAIDMLAQHLITKPVFDALFKDYAFSEQNPVSRAMQRMLDALDDQAIGEEARKLAGFYESVRVRAEGIDNHEGRQRVITELYEKFFRTALPKTAESLGIVYTPVEVVDFILRATDQALRRHLDTDLSAPGVHVIDPFTGTGTFIVRLLQSGLITPDDLLRKYTSELHANEIVLLAYYIAAVNIEAAFHDLWETSGGGAGYVPFDGIVLTDTFQLAEDVNSLEAVMFPENNERVRQQKSLDIRVVIGNPPYSAGQTSQNDGNANQRYPTLDRRIETTYAARSTATNKNSLYDSYIRAIRWASDRITSEGVICYVSNGGYIDSNTADGLRLTLAEEFSTIYCYNLRGNQRTAGELSLKEGGKIFGAGSRSTVAILLLVKTADPNHGCRIFYRDIGDRLTREQKLDILAKGDLDSVEWQVITPNVEGDWVNQRHSAFDAFTLLGEKNVKGTTRPLTVFRLYSRGLATGRDAWVYNYSADAMRQNVRRMINFYNSEVDAFHAWRRTNANADPARQVDDFIDLDPTKISWNRGTKSDLTKGRKYSFYPAACTVGIYRPFSRQHVYFDRQLNDMIYQLPKMFPTSDHRNSGFYLNGLHAHGEFAVLMVDEIPCLDLFGKGGQFFPRYTYEKAEVDARQLDLLSDSGDGDEFKRVDNITDKILSDYRNAYGSGVDKDDIFYYVYGLLHSPVYRTQFAADLKRMLPRIPKVVDFHGFAEAGRRLAELHLGYESVQPYPLEEHIRRGNLDDPALYRVQKMAFGVGRDRSRIIYNAHITLTGIPDEAYGYMLGSRSAVEWVMDRYQISVHKDSGIRNDPNDWSAHVGNPRYIFDLLKRVVTVSIETMCIVNALPPLDLRP